MHSWVERHLTQALFCISDIVNSLLKKERERARERRLRQTLLEDEDTLSTFYLQRT